MLFFGQLLVRSCLRLSVDGCLRQGIDPIRAWRSDWVKKPTKYHPSGGISALSLGGNGKDRTAEGFHRLAICAVRNDLLEQRNGHVCPFARAGRW
jgi:hypothetical protein